MGQSSEHIAVGQSGGRKATRDAAVCSETVAVMACRSYGNCLRNAIAGQFALLGGVERFVRKGDTVLLKPNLIAPRPRHCATQTDPAVIIEAAKLLKDFGARPFVGDSPAWGNVHTCARALELTEPLSKLGVPIRQLDKPVACRVGNARVGVSAVALGADVIVNLPKLKSHQQLVATFAVKNMFGCVSGKWKAYWHFAKGGSEEKFCGLLIEIYGLLNPVLTIIDGITAMDGLGPIRGRARPVGYLVAGTDPIACEMVCSRLIDLEPDDLPIIRTARRMRQGCIDESKMRIIGDAPTMPACTDFAPADLMPIRFSLPRVAKSICKQLTLLARSSIKRDGNAD